jgi:hypothetical protein
MLTKNKYSKYLLYAIGEIILVVIGILIALQINNRNELGKIDDKKQVHFDQLLVDIANDTTYINQIKNRTKNSIATYDAYIVSYSKPNMEIDTIINNLLKVEFQYPILTFKTNTMVSLIETGDIKLMPINIRNNILEIIQSQSGIINQTNELIPEYLRLLNDAGKIGFNRLYFIQNNQSKLDKLLNIKENRDEIILTLETAYGLKNYIEKDRIRSFDNLLSLYKNLELNIRNRKK